MGAVKAGMGLQSWAQFGLGVVTDIASAGINIGANSIVDTFGKTSAMAQFGAGTLRGVGGGVVNSFSINADGNLGFDPMRAVTSGVAGSLGNFATFGMSNQLTSSLVSGGITSMGDMAYNRYKDGHWKVADTLRTGAITSLSTYMASKIVGGVINNDGNTAYSNQIATGMLGHGIATGSEWLLAETGAIDKKDIRATDWNGLTEANAWQTATNDWRVKGDGSLPWETTAKQEQAGQQALPPNEQKGILQNLIGDFSGLVGDVAGGAAYIGGSIAGAVSDTFESVGNFAGHGRWETNSQMQSRQMNDFEALVADLSGNFATDKRAVTNDKLAAVMEMATELGLDASAIEAQIRSQQGAVDAEWANRAQASQAAFAQQGSQIVMTAEQAQEIARAGNAAGELTRPHSAEEAMEIARQKTAATSNSTTETPGIFSGNNTPQYTNGEFDLFGSDTYTVDYKNNPVGSLAKDVGYGVFGSAIKGSANLLSSYVGFYGSRAVDVMSLPGRTADAASQALLGVDLDGLQATAQSATPGFVGDDLGVAALQGSKMIGAAGSLLFASIKTADKIDDFTDAARAMDNASDIAKGSKTVQTVSKTSSFDDLARFVDNADVSTPKDGAVFWTGWKQGNQNAAMEFAEQNGKYTIEMTPGGKALDSLDLYGKNSSVTRAEADDLWDALSKRYASQATGKAHVFNSNTPYNETKVFYRTELPQLESNKIKIKYQSDYLNYLYNK